MSKKRTSKKNVGMLVMYVNMPQSEQKLATMIAQTGRDVNI